MAVVGCMVVVGKIIFPLTNTVLPAKPALPTDSSVGLSNTRLSCQPLQRFTTSTGHPLDAKRWHTRSKGPMA